MTTGGKVREERIEQKGKRTYGPGQVWALLGGRDIRGLNDNGEI